MKGIINVDSALGMGTTFTLIIPQHDGLAIEEIA